MLRVGGQVGTAVGPGKALRPVGFWRATADEASPLPFPSALVDATWPLRERVVRESGDPNADGVTPRQLAEAREQTELVTALS